MIRSFFRTLGSGLLQLVYPNLCWICAKPLEQEQRSFCEPCRSGVFIDPHAACPRCAATVGPFSMVNDGCPFCRDQGFAFHDAIRLGPYDGLLREMVLRIKSVRAEILAELLAEAWAATAGDRLRALGVDGVVPVPLHWWRRWQRGYNQSEALARMLAKALKVACYPSGLRRIRDTAQQTGKSATARRENVHNAFQASRWYNFKGRSLLLVDDVMTTGSTVHEAARALRQAGAKRVAVAVLARAEA